MLKKFLLKLKTKDELELILTDCDVEIRKIDKKLSSPDFYLYNMDNLLKEKKKYEKECEIIKEIMKESDE